jgi:P-type Cu2+ transporter
LIAGAINVGTAFTMRATSTAEASTEQRLMMLADDSSKPESLALADRVARYFMPLLITVATITFLALLPRGFDIAAERAIAVLIISCPCALALAAPAAHAAGFVGLLKRGIVTQRTSAIAVLARADVFVLDKTGTLSEPYVNGLAELRTGVNEEQVLAIIAALERASNHPLAKALQAYDLRGSNQLQVDDVKWVQGRGVSGRVSGIRYRFGRAEFIRRSSDRLNDGAHPARLWLSDDDGVVAAVDMSERPKAGVNELIDVLKRRGRVEIASGDRDDKTRSLANSLNIELAVGSCTPEQKAARIKQLQAQGHIVAMIGDGINDSIGFAGADVAIAVNTAAYAARASADMVALSDQPAAIATAIRYSQRISNVVKGNFVWAIGYNLVAVPVAIVGWVDPLVASIGMAASSAAVMLNVMRLRFDDGAFG